MRRPSAGTDPKGGRHVYLIEKGEQSESSNLRRNGDGGPRSFARMLA
jgi:hypothetical protein